MTAIDRIGVVVPARNEEASVVACLGSISDAAARVSVPVDIVLVADACTDDTVRLARRRPFVRVVEIDARSVGEARRRGVDELVTFHGLGGLWIATTDADSIVPADWLLTQLALAAEGADVVIGGVRPDPSALSESQQERWWKTHAGGRALGHVHGANLGLRAAQYAAVGGFASVPLHEDVELVARLRRAGAVVVATGAGEVITSARAVGRADGGYAEYLRTNILTE